MMALDVDEKKLQLQVNKAQTKKLLRELTPTEEQERERYRQERVRRAQTNPPVEEIYSAVALNDLLLDAQIRGNHEREVPLPDDVLRHINYSPGGSGRHAGLIRGGKLTWPSLLLWVDFQKEREILDAEIENMVRQLQYNSRVDTADLEKARAAIGQLKEKLPNVAKAASPEAMATQFHPAKDYLRDLGKAIELLEQKDAACYVLEDYALKGRTVSDLVRHMTNKGLRFEAALPADRGEYVALHRALAEFSSAEARAATN
jgi:hypothetical protein